MKSGDNTITVPSDTGHIREVSVRILEELSGYGLSEDILFDIRLCVEEAVRNAIVHGNRSSKSSKVKISYAIGPDSITIGVEDEGQGFDPKVVPDPTKDKNILKGSGRGVYLIRKLMDSVAFNAAGNRIEMTKLFGKNRNRSK